MRFIYNPVRAYSQQCQDPASAAATTVVRKRWYMGDFEIFQKPAPTSKTYQLHYINSDAGLVGIVVEESGSYQYYAVYTDHLGSIVTLTNDAGVVVAKQSYDAWGRERNPDTWDYGATLSAGGSTTPTPPEWLYRGYTGHEMLPEYGLINMNARLYDPFNGRMLRPDNLVSDPLNSQSYNRFSYANNNPLTFVDPDGNFPVAAVIIGVAFGMYTGGSMANGGQLNPAKWDFNSGKTWTYMAAGGLVGGFSGGLGAQIAQGGGFMANTMGIVFSSYTNSLGTALYTGGRSGMSVSFGIASYNFTNGDVGYLGEGWFGEKQKNKWYQNLGYALGGLANASDILAGRHPGSIDLNTENDPTNPTTQFSNTKDLIGHSQLSYKGKPLIDFGPNEAGAGFHFKMVAGTNNYEHGALVQNGTNAKWLNSVSIKGVNISRIKWYGDQISNAKYNLLYNSCVNQTSRALNMSGVFNIGLHPYVLHAQMYLRSIGIRPFIYSQYLQK